MTDTPVGKAWEAYYKPGMSSEEARAFQAGFDSATALEYEYAVRDESPTSYYGNVYGVGLSADASRAVAVTQGDTAVRRVRAGEWEAYRG